MEKYLRVGVISSTHGIRGEVKVYPTTDDAARFKDLKKVLLDTGRELRELEIGNVKFFKNMVILKFKGLDSMNDVETWRNADLLITRDQAVKLNPGENFVADMIGLSAVTDEGEKLGTLTDVMFTGANDVYVIDRGGGKELLIPAIPSCVLDVNLEEGIILIHLLDGLLDL